MKHLFIILVACLLSFGTYSGASAQCAMCKATVESNSKTGNTSIGKGLNKGILYLMTIPYALVGIVGYLWYKNSKKSAQRNAEARLDIKRNISTI